MYWQDARWLDSEDIYGQLVTSAGRIAPAWPDTGLMIVRAPDLQFTGPGFALEDGSFLVTLGDLRDFHFGGTLLDPYISRVRPDATIDPAWPRHGFQAVSGAQHEGPQIVGWVARDTLLILWTALDGERDVFGQRVAISSPGPVALWSMDGVRLAGDRPREAHTLGFAPDGAGGCFIAFDDVRSPSDTDPGDSDVYLTRVGRDGAPHPAWTLQGRPVAEAVSYQQSTTACEDGSGGVYVVWSDARSGGVLPPYSRFWDYNDIRLARFDAEGTLVPGWSAEGLILSARPGWQDYPQLLPDGTGGVWAVWDDYTGGVSLTHVLADGSFAPGWQQDGLRVSTLEAYQSEPKMVPDGMGGLYVRIIDGSRGDLYLQHVLGSGARDPLWPAEGHLVTQFATNGSGDCDIAADGQGGCYVTFQRRLGGTGPLNLHLTRFSPDGVVPVKLAEATAEAEPGRVHLEWHGVESVGPGLTVQRRPDGIETWTSIGAPVVRGSDLVDYDDTTVEPAGRYAYRLTRGVDILSEEEWVTVPVHASFALRGARPNPALARDLSVELSLAGVGVARLEVLDLAGRREYARELANLEPGRHVLPLAEAQLAPGVHWLRLVEGARSAHARVVVVR